MLNFKGNLGRLDQILRIGFGSACFYLGFFENIYLQHGVLSMLVGVFGIFNLIFALLCSCPVYKLAGINTSTNAHTSQASLQLRNRLLFLFIAVAMVIVTVYGVTSFYVAKEFSSNKEIHLLELFSKYKSQAISKSMESEKFDYQALPDTGKYIILNEKFEPKSPLPHFLNEKQLHILLTHMTRKKSKHSGSATIDSNIINWSLAPIPNSKQFLFIYHRTDNQHGTVRSLENKFFLTALILLWFAIWGALILSSVVSKKLNQQNDLLNFQSLHDTLTGLPNRHSLLSNIEQSIKNSDSNNNLITLFIFDINRFKDVNDMLGHRSGDELLRIFSLRMQSAIQSEDCLARIEGDEFAILTNKISHDELADYISNIFNLLDAPFLLKNLEIQCEISMGVVFYSCKVEDPLCLIRKAEVAMYQAKHRNQDYVIYSSESDTSNVNQLTVITELRQAISNNELCLYYQPKVDMQTGKTISLEALIRWNHPTRGFLYPDAFIPQAEQTGLIRPLTIWTLNETMQQIVHWQSVNIHLPVAVNFSQRLLSHHHLIADIHGMLKSFNIAPEMLELEITESAVMSEAAGATQMLLALETLGIPLSIDDFGTGFTSLSQLKNLPVQTLKIDKSFVQNIADSKHDLTIVNSIIQLAHNMGHKVIAEGIENINAWNILHKMGCDTGQGYYMARPMPAEEVENWLHNSDWPIADSHNYKNANGN